MSKTNNTPEEYIALEEACAIVSSAIGKTTSPEQLLLAYGGRKVQVFWDFSRPDVTALFSPDSQHEKRDSYPVELPHGVYQLVLLTDDFTEYGALATTDHHPSPDLSFADEYQSIDDLLDTPEDIDELGTPIALSLPGSLPVEKMWALNPIGCRVADGYQPTWPTSEELRVSKSDITRLSTALARRRLDAMAILERPFARLDNIAWAMVMLSPDGPGDNEERYRKILGVTRWLNSLALQFRHSDGFPASQPKGVPVDDMDVREYQYLAVADVRVAAITSKCWPALASANWTTPDMSSPDFDEHWTIAEAAKIIGTDEAGIYERFLDGRLKASVFFAKTAPAQLVKTSNPLWLTDKGDVKAFVANELRRVRYVWDLTLYNDKKLYNANLYVVRCRYFALKHGTAVDTPEVTFGIFVQRGDDIYRLMQSQSVNGEVPHAQDLPDGAVLVVRKSELVDSGALDEAKMVAAENPHKPNWGVWRDALKGTLREAVCLSCDADPEAVPRDLAGILQAELLPQTVASKGVRNEISRRLKIAKSNTGTGGTLPTMTDGKDTNVYLATFAEWAINTMKWAVPDELRVMADTTPSIGAFDTKTVITKARGKLTSEQRDQIIQRGKQGETHQKLANEFGVTRQYVTKLCSEGPKNTATWIPSAATKGR